MLDWLRRRQIPIAAGVVATAALLAADLLLPKDWHDGVRNAAFDLVLAADQRVRPVSADRVTPQIVVVDIDRRSLEAIGPWPWPRATMALLIDAIAAAKPSIAAIDILFAAHDSRSSTAPVDRRAEGDKLLAQAIGRVPIVLGFVLDPKGVGAVPHVPIAVRGAVPLDDLWGADGADVPPADLVGKARGIGTLSLPADRDGVVRDAPLLVAVGRYLLPGLALEVVRIARGASVYLLQAPPLVLTAGDLKIPITPDGLLRLRPVTSERRAARTIAAVDVLQHRVAGDRLAGALVLLGGSAPELGGLRETVTDPLTPSVQIQADAVEQIMAGRFPRPVAWSNVTQPLLLLGLALLALMTSVALPPLLGATAVVAVVCLAWVAAIASSLLTDRLVDPLSPSLAAAAVFVIASVTSFAVTHRREALIRRRFEQRLAPAVVRRIIEQPGLIKLGAERREVTALFTDIEGFTAMTHRADPSAMVAALDVYFENVGAMIVAHGGMVDKMVGDAVHAIFNAPLDLDDHPGHAMACAIEIRAWTESYRATAAAAALGLGRTRIGIETGEALVGDVGLRSKLDYTAYGDAMNSAARFEAANKTLGSAICIGPAAAARCDAAALRPLGTISVAGREETAAVSEPWPLDASPQWRAQYLAAFELASSSPAQAAELFERLAEELPGDAVVRVIVQKLRAKGSVHA
jgi:adenylate cyclase